MGVEDESALERRVIAGGGRLNRPVVLSSPEPLKVLVVDHVGQPIDDGVKVQDYTVMQTAEDGTFAHGVRSYIKNGMVRQLTPGLIDAHAHLLIKTEDYQVDHLRRSSAYKALRGLSVAEGRLPAMLGECVLGARAAERLAVSTGDHVVSSPESVFDLAGVYPLKLEVVGVLAPSHGPDDQAVFVDLKTAWVAEGKGHGHGGSLVFSARSVELRKEDRRANPHPGRRAGPCRVHRPG